MRFYRVAREGKTIDNRDISAEHIKQMADNYDTEVYGARVWLEHFRGIFPDGAFKALGDVKALKTEKDKHGKLCLLADIDPTADLIKMNQDKQKIYTSIEITPSFSDSGEAYLTGLAVTDSPASTGTTALMFAATSTEPNHLFSSYEESQFSLMVDHSPGDLDGEQSPSFFNKVKSMFAKQDDIIGKQSEDVQALFADMKSAVELGFSEIQKNSAEKDTTFAKLEAKFAELEDKFTQLNTTLDATPESNDYSERPPAAGGDSVVLTDC